MKKQILILALLLPLLAGCTAKQPEPLPCTPGEAQRLVVYTAEPGSESYEKLQLLSVIGSQRLPV